MQTTVEAGLGHLNEKLLMMGSYAESAVSQAVRAVVERDDHLAVQVQADDDIMDKYEMEIDELALQLLARAPQESQLRMVAVAMKISANLERIGDEATTIARRAAELNQGAPLRAPVEISRMAAVALAMLKESLDCFVNKMPENARAIVPRDKEVDAMNRRNLRDLAAHMEQHPGSIARGLHWITVSKSLERVADHAASIAEHVVYLCEARDIRHEALHP